MPSQEEMTSPRGSPYLSFPPGFLDRYMPEPHAYIYVYVPPSSPFFCRKIWNGAFVKLRILCISSCINSPDVFQSSILSGSLRFRFRNITFYSLCMICKLHMCARMYVLVVEDGSHQSSYLFLISMGDSLDNCILDLYTYIHHTYRYIYLL